MHWAILNVAEQKLKPIHWFIIHVTVSAEIVFLFAGALMFPSVEPFAQCSASLLCPKTGQRPCPRSQHNVLLKARQSLGAFFFGNSLERSTRVERRAGIVLSRVP